MTWSRLDLYEAVHTGNPGDVGFYVGGCRRAGSVLELGCGGGRVLLPVASVVCPRGGRVVGLDVAADALERLQGRLRPALAERVSLVRADMREFALEERFERVIIPYNALYALASDEDMVACLAAARRHLAPGGRLLFDGYRVPEEDADSDELLDDEPGLLATVVRGEDWFEVYEQALPVDAPRSLQIHYRYRVWEGGAEEAREVWQVIHHHYLTPSTLRPVVARAGLEIEALWGDFERGAVHSASEHLVVRARVAAGEGA